MAVHLSIGRKLSRASIAVLGWTLVIGSASYMIASDPEIGTAPKPRAAAVAPEPASTENRATEVAATARPAEFPEPATTLPAAVVEAAWPPSPPGPAMVVGSPVVLPGQAGILNGAALQTPSAETPATGRAAQTLETTQAPETTQTTQTLGTTAAEAGSPDQAHGNGIAARAPQPAATQSAALQAGITAARPIAEPKDLAGPVPRPEYMSPIPARAPRPAGAGAIAVDTRKLFQRGVEIKIRRDAEVYITARNIPKNDSLLEAYSADQPNGGRVQTNVGEATAVPGLLGIAAQAQRAQDPSGQNGRVYSLADAMRDAIWRKKTAARLKSLTTAQNSCAGGATKNAPTIGLLSAC